MIEFIAQSGAAGASGDWRVSGRSLRGGGIGGVDVGGIGGVRLQCRVNGGGLRSVAVLQ